MIMRLPLFMFTFGAVYRMKSILSPYDDSSFNEYLLQYTKKYLRRKCSVFMKDDEERKYFLEENSRDFYTVDDIINSLKLNGRVIYFSNKPLINYAVYDLSQTFWVYVLNSVNNIIHKLYLEFKGSESSIQKRKLSHNKLAINKSQGVRR